jgi:hypothetical protein
LADHAATMPAMGPVGVLVLSAHVEPHDARVLD